MSNKNALQGANVRTSCTSLGQNSSDNSSNKQTQSTHRNARLEPAIRDAQKLARNVFPHRNSTVMRSKKQENEKPEMCLMFFRCGDITPQHFDAWQLSWFFSKED